jgi:hypothetical protein
MSKSNSFKFKRKINFVQWIDGFKILTLKNERMGMKSQACTDVQAARGQEKSQRQMPTKVSIFLNSIG